jgi:HAD-superfamily hydrolase, subfamily IIB
LKNCNCDFKGILIATDLDGTFVREDKTLSERNLEAVERFKAGGGLFTFSTGRVLWSMAELVPSYREIINAPAVLCNGATLYDPVAGRDIFADLLDTREIIKAIDFIRGEFPETQRFLYIGDEYTQTEDLGAGTFDPADTRGWHKLLVFCPKERISALEERVRAAFPNEFAFSRSASFLFELLPPGSTKGSMLRRLKKCYSNRGVNLTAYAVGDYDNDLDMLRAADVACCPENALDSVKASCTVRLCKCCDGAIADLIDRISEDTRSGEALGSF